MKFPKDRFYPGTGVVTKVADIHESLFIRKGHKKQYTNVTAYNKDPRRFLNRIGEELWTILFVTKEGDPIHTIAKMAITTGSATDYLVLLDMIEEQEIASESEIAEARYAANLWANGTEGQELDLKMRQMYGPREELKPRIQGVLVDYPHEKHPHTG